MKAEPSLADPLLEVTGLGKTFGGIRAVHDVHLRVLQGERHAIIGPNGAGKTTLFHLITRLLRPDSGSVIFDRERIDHLAPARICAKGVARTFQITSVFPELSVMTNVQIGLFARHRMLYRLFTPAEHVERERGEALLEEVGLEGKASHLVRELSYGDRHRLEIAMTLSLDPRLLVLDEPAAGLGEHERRRVRDLLLEISQRRSLTLLFSDHDMDVVFAVADRVTVMNQGQVMAEGEPSDIRVNEDVKRIYLGS